MPRPGTSTAQRQVPIDVACIGEKANATRPEIEQILIYDPELRDEAIYERDLYVIRRKIEKQAIAAQISKPTSHGTTGASFGDCRKSPTR